MGDEETGSSKTAPHPAGDSSAPTPKDHLTLKWGTLKAWHFHSEPARALLKEYFAEGASDGAMTQDDTPRQREIICELIDIGNFETVFLDWDGKHVSKEEAKQYMASFRNKPPRAALSKAGA